MINKKFEARKKPDYYSQLIATNRKFDYLRWFGKRTITWCTSTIFLFKIPLIFYNMSSWPRMMLFSLTTNNPGCLMNGRAWVGCLPLCRWVLVLQDVGALLCPWLVKDLVKYTCRKTGIWGSWLPRFQGFMSLVAILTSSGQNYGLKRCFW